MVHKLHAAPKGLGSRSRHYLLHFYGCYCHQDLWASPSSFSFYFLPLPRAGRAAQLMGLREHGLMDRGPGNPKWCRGSGLMQWEAQMMQCRGTLPHPSIIVYNAIYLLKYLFLFIIICIYCETWHNSNFNSITIFI